MTTNQHKLNHIQDNESVEYSLQSDGCEINQGNDIQQQALALKSAPILAELPEGRLKILATKATWLTYLPGSYIVNHYDELEMIFIIVSGFVKISCKENYTYSSRPDKLPERRQNSRRKLIVALRGPGDIVGSVPSLLEIGVTADALALTTCQVVAIPCRDFLVCIQNHPNFARAVTYKIARNRIQSERRTDSHLTPCD